MFTDEYKTIEAPAEASISDRGCRFIALIVPVDSVQKTEEFITQLRLKHSDALDCVYAMRIGLEPERIQRFGGSERFGSILLGVLESGEVTNTAVAVLREPEENTVKDASDRAYRDAAANALRRAKVVTRILYDVLRFQISLDDADTVSRLIGDHRGKIVQTVHEPDLILSVKIRKIQSEDLKKILTATTQGRIKVL